MIKKILLASLVLSQLAISCSSDDSDDTKPETELSLKEQIAELVKKPYSELTPEQQKSKLEAEANEMLTQLDKTKSSGAIEALENLSRLLDVSSVDIFNGKNDNKAEDILNVSGVYGIYTWNNATQKWVKTASSTELKFVFPAKKSQTANNASFSAKSTSSDIKVAITDTYNWSTGVEVNDYIFLPTTSDAILTIDGKESATFNQTAKYSNGKEVPEEFAYKMFLNDGYTWQMSSKKGTANSASASLTFNGKTLINFNGGSNANIDALIDNDELVQYRGKANGLFQLMDNFVILADTDLAAEAADKATLRNTVKYPQNYNSPTYYDDVNAFYKKYEEGKVANYNKNVKPILVSKKDGTKIADIVQRVEKGYSYVTQQPVWVADKGYSEGGYWTYEGAKNVTVQYYESVDYLKFNDKTEVSMDTYFSTGFSTFKNKFEEFEKAFDK
ncbi:hypothetical protein K6T82_19035 [Flavobacterium sp. 17A]|uniref:Uncharacterized protein n=1 Tax=Flavobacterium potami TaxID=2872310 RepID=A0A9X1HCP0_9FLAO|nr:hypothetical protein [Flavobacterium potami]MBZ4036873.1 hypothetical protein [Flavobacterium potami]